MTATSELGQLFDHKQTTRGHATIRAVDPYRTRHSIAADLGFGGVAILPGQPATERRLAAILAADVVGHRRLMEADEAGTLATLKARRKGCCSRSSPSIGAT